MEPSTDSVNNWAQSSLETQQGHIPSYARKDNVSAAKLHTLDRHLVKSIRFSVDSSLHQVDHISSPRNTQATSGIEQIDVLRDTKLPVTSHADYSNHITIPNLSVARPVTVFNNFSSVGISSPNLPQHFGDGNGEHWARGSDSNNYEYIKVSGSHVLKHSKGNFSAARATSPIFLSFDSFHDSNPANEKHTISCQQQNQGISIGDSHNPGRVVELSHILDSRHECLSASRKRRLESSWNGEMIYERPQRQVRHWTL